MNEDENTMLLKTSDKGFLTIEIGHTVSGVYHQNTAGFDLTNKTDHDAIKTFITYLQRQLDSCEEST